MKFFERFGDDEPEPNQDPEEIPFPGESPSAKETLRKSKELGWFSLTAEDHKSMGSSLSEHNELMQNPGKAQYEVMTDQEIEKTLDKALEDATTNEKKLVNSGYAQLQKDFFIKSLAFLKSVGRLPKKFEDFDLSSLPDLHLSKEE